MFQTCFVRCFLVLSLACGVVAAQAPKADPPAKTTPAFIDDEKLFEDFMSGLTNLAKEGKCLPNKKLLARMKPGSKAKVVPAKSGEKVLSPEDVYKLALPSVFVVGSVYKDKDGDWQDGSYATAWVAAPDGVLVTNWHVFEDLEDSEVFGAIDHKGNLYPVIDFLGGDKIADVAVFRIDAKGLTPLPIAEEFAPVGSWVAVLSHPGDNFYVFTTGSITRYSTNKNEDGKRERWMGLTAEYAGGSSGGPVLNNRGAVVGMAALTLTIDDGSGAAEPAPGRRKARLGQPPKAPLPKDKIDPKDQPKPKDAPGADAKPEPVGPTVQMIMKMAVPGPTILKSFGAKAE